MIIQEEAMQIIRIALHEARPDEALKRAGSSIPVSIFRSGINSTVGLLSSR